MSASPMARQTVDTQAIPIKRVLVDDPSEMPNYYSQTPGGTLFSTTPGGTKIVYEKTFLLNLRNSPISNTPPSCDIPDNLLKGSGTPPKKHYNGYNNQRRLSLNARNRRNSHTGGRRNSTQDEDQFHMDL